MKEGYIKENIASLLITAFILFAAIWSLIKGDGNGALKLGVFAIVLAGIVVWNYARHNSEEYKIKNWFSRLTTEEKKALYEGKK